jgi:hypothetical protein
MQDDDQPQDQKANVFQEQIDKHAETEIKPDAQARINKPMEGKMDDADRAFLNDVISKVDSEEVKLHEPQSLLNKDIYEGLPPESEQKVDMLLQTLLFSLRQIKSWHDAGEQENIQMANMIHDVRIKKENLENEVGDVLKI